ncbi:MAG TPA: hypothetical protein VEU62_22740 [Bryobacterales bacterium]|nr:hypothetical protein [Bryobacterales bacterium]
MKNFRAALLALFLILWIAPRQTAAQITPEQEKQLFSRVDEVFRQVSDIMGMKIRHPVPRAVITREKIRDYINQRMKEVLPPEEIRAQEIVLMKFGFVGPDFDLKAQTLDLLTEQAAAFYDFKQKKLYLASWTPSSMQDIALVHELSHALADQHFKLEKFIDKSGNDDDASTARGAVVEGQASWVMTEYMLRQAGQSLKDSPKLAESTAGLTAEGAKEFPVFGAAPLYMQVTMMFPYTEGMLFQQAVVQKLGAAAFAEVFRHPPVSSQQIIHPDQYFARTVPAKPALPTASLPSGCKKLMEGTMGELDFQILLRQFSSEQEAQRLAPRWRGSRYALWENKKEKRDVLLYSVQWADEADAARYFADYKKAAAKKWKQLRFDADQARSASGSGDDGHFEWRLQGPVFTATEGLP